MIPISDDNPTRQTPIVTWSILILCVGVFLWELSFGIYLNVKGFKPSPILSGAGE